MQAPLLDFYSVTAMMQDSWLHCIYMYIFLRRFFGFLFTYFMYYIIFYLESFMYYIFVSCPDARSIDYWNHVYAPVLEGP
jgi:hypothetical protein